VVLSFIVDGPIYTFITRRAEFNNGFRHYSLHLYLRLIVVLSFFLKKSYFLNINLLGFEVRALVHPGLIGRIYIFPNIPFKNKIINMFTLPFFARRQRYQVYKRSKSFFLAYSMDKLCEMCKVVVENTR